MIIQKKDINICSLKIFIQISDNDMYNANQNKAIKILLKKRL